MKIRVTQEDIDRGLKHTPIACPVALAVERVLGLVSVGHYWIIDNKKQSKSSTRRSY